MTRPHLPAARRRAHVRLFVRRMVLHAALSATLLLVSLGVGMWGFAHFEGLAWRDAFLNAAMLLSGMGPVDTSLSDDGKVFAGLYALYSGLAVIAVTGLLLAPGVHHLMGRVHWEEDHPE